MAKFDIYQEVTNRIIEQLEQGNIPWHKPWGGIIGNGGAYNRVTKKSYSLLNQMLLMHDGEYASFNISFLIIQFNQNDPSNFKL